MEIVRARDMGFCYGVRRAVDMMQTAAEQRGEIATLGSIVHNPLVTERLAQSGIEIVSNVNDAGTRPIAITAHGVGPDVVEAMEQQGLDVIDTTCPIVTRAQQWARKLKEEGYAVIVFGDPNHKEVRGILAWADGKAIAVQDEKGLEELPDELPSRVAVLVQTTHTEAHFASFVRRLFETRMERISELRVVCTELGTPAYHIERADELQPEWVASARRVGLTAGASTPDFSIDAVEQRLRELEGEVEASAARRT